MCTIGSPPYIIDDVGNVTSALDDLDIIVGPFNQQEYDEANES